MCFVVRVFSVQGQYDWKPITALRLQQYFIKRTRDVAIMLLYRHALNISRKHFSQSSSLCVHDAGLACSHADSANVSFCMISWAMTRPSTRSPMTAFVLISDAHDPMTYALPASRPHCWHVPPASQSCQHGMKGAPFSSFLSCC